jgi:hypothetical protein
MNPKTREQDSVHTKYDGARGKRKERALRDS